MSTDVARTAPAYPVTVSAIVTTYNYAAFICDAIDSILAQTRPPDEIVVIDDGSTDATQEIVATYADRGVRYVRQENQGAGAVRNRGLDETNGDLVAYLDADDIWLPDKLERQLQWLAEHPDAALVSGQRIWWHVERDHRSIMRFPQLTRDRFVREISIRNVVGNPSMTVIRRAAIERVGAFDSTLRWGQDWEMFVRLSRVGEVGFVPDPVVIYRGHRTSLSHDRRWERLDTIHVIAQRAIEGHHPRWQRPILRLRAWSAIEYDRARIAIKQPLPRHRKIGYASRALAAWPLDDTVGKFTLFARSLIGESTYRRAMDGLRTRRRRLGASG